MGASPPNQVSPLCNLDDLGLPPRANGILPGCDPMLLSQTSAIFSVSLHISDREEDHTEFVSTCSTQIVPGLVARSPSPVRRCQPRFSHKDHSYNRCQSVGLGAPASVPDGTGQMDAGGAAVFEAGAQSSTPLPRHSPTDAMSCQTMSW